MSDLTTLEKLRQAKTPGAMISILGRTVDALEKRVAELEARPDDAPPADEWALLDDDTEPIEPGAATTDAVKVAVQAELDELKEAAKSLSGEDLDANRAKQRLVADGLRDVQSVEPEPEDETVAVEFGPDGSTTIDLPPVPPEIEAERREFAVTRMKMREYYMGEGHPEKNAQAFVQSYGKGGPILFWLADRKYVMTLPREVRTAMVVDAARFSPGRAKDMGRDILQLKIDEDGKDHQAVVEAGIQSTAARL